MRSFGLTGGIATGKSTAARIMLQIDPRICLFDADACVAELYKRREVIEKVAELFGPEVIAEDGMLDRASMRQIVFSDEKKKSQLQDLIHPMVRKECLAMQQKAAHSASATLFVADVPLLFEGGFDFGQEANLVVAVSRETQVQRLIMRNGFSEATVFAILAAQFPISRKMECADIVLWNEGPISVLEAQIYKFISQINHE